MSPATVWWVVRGGPPWTALLLLWLKGLSPILLPPASSPRLPDLQPATGLLVPTGVLEMGSAAVSIAPSLPSSAYPRVLWPPVAIVGICAGACLRSPLALTSRGLCRVPGKALDPVKGLPSGHRMARSTAQAFQSPRVCDPRTYVLAYGALPRQEGGHVLGSSPVWCGWPASSLQPRERTSQQLLRASGLRESLQGTGGPRLCGQGLFQAGGCTAARWPACGV